MKKFRAGIVGCGNIYPMHANALKKIPSIELVAVCDSHQERLERASTAYCCRGYTDYLAMLDRETLDVVHICLPHHLHEWATVEAATRNIHVLTEKPAATSLSAAKRMNRAAESYKIKYGVIFQNRYNVGAQKLKDLLVANYLGVVKAAKLQVTWSRDEQYYASSDWKGTWEKEGGGVIIDQAIHTLDLLNWLLDGTPEFVEATIKNRFHPDIEVEDFAEGIIHYKEGFTVSFLANNYYSYDAPVEIEIHTEKAIAKIIGAKLTVDFFDNRDSIVADIDKKDYIANGIATKTYWGTGHIIQIKEFYDWVSGQKNFLVTGEEANKTQKIVDSIYRSSRLNKRIFL